MNNGQTTKRLLWAGSWVLSLFAAFGIGIWQASWAFEMVISSFYLPRALEEAVQTQHALELLDKGSFEEARKSLKLRVDAYVLTVAAHSERTASEKDREATDKFLRRVAEHRTKHKTAYSDGLLSGEFMREFHPRIAEILKSKESNKR